MPPLLSKSKYLSGLQCVKRLWLEIHKPELIPEVSPSLQKIFDQGTDIGRLARERFPDGVLVEADHQHIPEALQQTQAALSQGATALFEGAFAFSDTLARADILQRAPGGAWELIEVKSATKAKDVNLDDIAFQTYVLRGSGLNVTAAYLMHLDNECVYPDLTNLFTPVNVTDVVQELLPDIPKNIENLRQALARDKEPDVSISEHCEKPYECPFCAYCWDWVPEYSIFNLPRLPWTTKTHLLATGKVRLEELPENFDLNEAQARFVESHETKQPVVDWLAIQAELSQLKYPLHFLDFETDNPALPRIDGMHPYEKFPFQFSCHILDSDGNLEHREYLHETDTDPRRPLVESLRSAIGKEGNIVAYNAGFEKGVLNNLARWFPEHKDLLLNWTRRLWDQLDIFRKYYMDYRFGGSNSIKSVLSVLIPEMSYDNLSVKEGGEAGVAWNEMIRLSQSPEKEKLIHDLKTYCGQDSLAMVEIHKLLSIGIAGL